MKTATLERRSLLQELALRGVRITGQRKILIETIQEAARHLDAATLLELARKRDERINRKSFICQAGEAREAPRAERGSAQADCRCATPPLGRAKGQDKVSAVCGRVKAIGLDAKTAPAP